MPSLCVLGEEHHSIAELPCSAVSTFPPPKGQERGANGDRTHPLGKGFVSCTEKAALGLIFIVWQGGVHVRALGSHTKMSLHRWLPLSEMRLKTLMEGRMPGFRQWCLEKLILAKTCQH